MTSDSQSVDIERFSDWGKSKSTSKRDKLNNFLQLTSVHFPAELVQGWVSISFTSVPSLSLSLKPRFNTLVTDGAFNCHLGYCSDGTIIIQV